MMNFTQYASDFTNQVSPSSLPVTLWNYYMKYLWYHEQNSWVARIAYTCRVLAVLVSLPVLIFTLLDVSSYVLARTLGVIDDVKASTSDKETMHEENETTPTIHIEMPSEDSSTSFSESDHGSSVDHSAQRRSHNSSPPTTDEDGAYLTQFYAGGDDHNNLELSGVGVFSPAASLPASPIAGRKQLAFEGKELRHRALPHVEEDV